jgi:hypothetical protein
MCSIITGRAQGREPRLSQIKARGRDCGMIGRQIERSSAMRHVFLAALVIAAGPALSEDAWQQIDTIQPATGLPSSYWVASPGLRQLELHCDGDEASPGLMMVLFGGTEPLPADVEREDQFPVSVQLAPSGEIRAVMASWFGPLDNALNGGFPSDPAFLDAFAQSERLILTGPLGGVLFETPMTGAAWARFGFGEVCGV